MPPFKPSPDNPAMTENPDIFSAPDTTDLRFDNDQELGAAPTHKGEEALPPLDEISNITQTEAEKKSSEITAEKNSDTSPPLTETKNTVEPPPEVIAQFGKGAYENSYARQISGRIDLKTGVEYGLDGKAIDLSSATPAEISDYNTFKQKLIDNIGSVVVSSKEVKTENGTELHVNLFKMELDGTMSCEGWKRIIEEKKIEPPEPEKNSDVGGAFDGEIIGGPSVSVTPSPELTGVKNVGGFSETVAANVEPTKAVETKIVPPSIFEIVNNRGTVEHRSVLSDSSPKTADNKKQVTDVEKNGDLENNTLSKNEAVKNTPEIIFDKKAEIPEVIEKPIKMGEIITFKVEILTEKNGVGSAPTRENEIVEKVKVTEKIEPPAATEVTVKTENGKITEPISESSPEVTGITLEVVEEGADLVDYKNETGADSNANLQTKKIEATPAEAIVIKDEVIQVDKKTPLELYGIDIESTNDEDQSAEIKVDPKPNYDSESGPTTSVPKQPVAKDATTNSETLGFEKAEQSEVSTIHNESDTTLVEAEMPQPILSETVTEISNATITPPLSGAEEKSTNTLTSEQKDFSVPVITEKNDVENKFISEPAVELATTAEEPTSPIEIIQVEKNNTDTIIQKTELSGVSNLVQTDKLENLKADNADVIARRPDHSRGDVAIPLEVRQTPETDAPKLIINKNEIENDQATGLLRQSQSLLPRNDVKNTETLKTEKTPEIKAETVVGKKQPAVEQKITELKIQKVEKDTAPAIQKVERVETPAVSKINQPTIAKIPQPTIIRRGIQPRTQRPTRRTETNIIKESTQSVAAPNFIQRTKTVSPISRVLNAVRPTELMRSLTRRPTSVVDQKVVDQKSDEKSNATQLRIIRYANNS